MAGKIFINYRREDSIATAGRLADRLAETFDRDNLFMDVDNIPVGINFDEYLKSQVAACDVVLSVIGPNWLNAKDEANQRRLDKPDDFVAIELAAALARNILVIPVLVDGTRMPKARELPDSLKPFALRNAIQLRNTNFGSDAEQLITKMREALALVRPERTEDLVMLSFNAYLVAAFLLNIGFFLTALAMFFQLSGNFAGALAAMVAAMPIFHGGWAAPRAGRERAEVRYCDRRWGLASCSGDPCISTVLPRHLVREPHHTERDPVDGHLFFGRRASLHLVEENGHGHLDAQGNCDLDEIGELAVALGLYVPVEHADGVGDLRNPLSIDAWCGRCPYAGGRPTAGGRLVLRPISQDACRKSPPSACLERPVSSACCCRS